MTWVMFDYGGVICSPQPEQELSPRWRPSPGSPVTQFRDAYWARRLAYDLAELTADGVLAGHRGAGWAAGGIAR